MKSELPDEQSKTGRWRRALWTAALAGALITGFAVGARKVVQPLHARGWLQPVTSVIDSVAGVVEAPGREIVMRKLPGRLDRFKSKAAVLATFAIWTAAGLGWQGLGAVRVKLPWNRMASRPDEERIGSECAKQASRRWFMSSAVQRAAALGAIGTFGYASVLEPRKLRVTRVTFPLRGLPMELSGLRIVQITDVHHGPWLSSGDLHRIVNAANALKPDLIVLTGDYVLHEKVYALPVVSVLSGLRAPIGVVAVLGNHDWHESAAVLRGAFGRVGIPMLDNTRLFLRPDHVLVRESDAGLCIAGVGDYWHDRQLYDAALGGVPEGMPRVLLSHNPDVAEDRKFLVSGHRVDLMLSGHTHGGQVKIPGVGALVTYSRFGTKYLHGLAQGPACPVLTCAGVGMSKMPVRIGVPPEIVEIRLVRA